ncbi:MAG: GAF domain-containing protein [Anaerolineales bacterium]|nr:MAG: GAF domain-containing protein [Anaerolineales bacterium]
MITPAYSLHMIADLKPGEHLCCIYETEEEHRVVVTPFLRRGLERGEKVLYIVDARPTEAILGYLQDGGLDVEPYLASGQLAILTRDDTYMREGIFDPERMVALLRAETEQTLDEGYPALRVTGEMTWALRGLPGSEWLIEYEARLNEFFPGSKCVGLCQYDRRRFDPAVLLGMLHIHPTAFIGAEVYDNFYYIPPAELLGRDLPAAKLRHCLEKLAERKRAEAEREGLLTALTHRNIQLQTAAEVSKSASTILDPEELMNQAVNLIQKRFDFYYVGLFLVDEVGEYAVLRSGTGEAGRKMLEADHRLAVGGESMIGWSVANAKARIALDVGKEAIRFDNPLLSGTRSEMALPLISHGQCIGALTVQSTEETAFSVEDITVLQTMADQVAIAIENARLYQEIVRRLKETEALDAVTTTLTHSLDLDQVLQTIVDSATRLIPASTGGVIHLADEAAGKLIRLATSPGGNVQKSMEMSIGEGIASLTMQKKRLINVPNVEEDPRFLTIDTASPNKSLLTAPLLIDRDCIGTLSLNSDQMGAFSADDERLLTTLAAQAAIAVRNARLHQEGRRRVEELVFLNRVGRAITSSLNLEQVLTTVMEETALMLGTEAGSISLLDEESNELVFEAAVGPRSEEMKGLRLPLGQGIAGWVAREGQRLLVPDVKEDPRFYPGIDGATGFATRSLLAVPLKVKGKVIGVIEAVNKTEGYFSQADVALLSSMVQSAAIAIENARLYKDLQDRMEELKRTQAQLIQSAKLAAIGELAAGVAHEINNPLASIVGFARLLLQAVDDDDPMREDLQIIDREAARTRAIVRALLDFARQREPRLEPVDVNEIVRTTMTLIRHQAKGARVTIKESYDETLPPVSLDADQIKQVFLNMVTNAIQAMPQGGELKVVTAYRPRAQSPELAKERGPDGSTGSPQRLVDGMDGADRVTVEFHDTGAGISAEDLPRIFDPFFTTKKVDQGTGLGLSISHGIVERHGGRIEVESEVGQGSTFTVMLPVTEGQRKG